MVLIKRYTKRSMVQNGDLSNGPTEVSPTNFWFFTNVPKQFSKEEIWANSAGAIGHA